VEEAAVLPAVPAVVAEVVVAVAGRLSPPELLVVAVVLVQAARVVLAAVVVTAAALSSLASVILMVPGAVEVVEGWVPSQERLQTLQEEVARLAPWLEHAQLGWLL